MPFLLTKECQMFSFKQFMQGKIQELESAIRERDGHLDELQAQHEVQLKEILTNIEAEQKKKDLDHQAELKVVKDRLDKERENMKSFKVCLVKVNLIVCNKKAEEDISKLKINCI